MLRELLPWGITAQQQLADLMTVIDLYLLYFVVWSVWYSIPAVLVYSARSSICAVAAVYCQVTVACVREIPGEGVRH